MTAALLLNMIKSRTTLNNTRYISTSNTRANTRSVIRSDGCSDAHSDTYPYD